MPKTPIRAQFELSLDRGFASLDDIYAIIDDGGFAVNHLEVLRADGAAHCHLVVLGDATALVELDQQFRQAEGVRLGVGVRTCTTCRSQRGRQ